MQNGIRFGDLLHKVQECNFHHSYKVYHCTLLCPDSSCPSSRARSRTGSAARCSSRRCGRSPVRRIPAQFDRVDPRNQRHIHNGKSLYFHLALYTSLLEEIVSKNYEREKCVQIISEILTNFMQPNIQAKHDE